MRTEARLFAGTAMFFLVTGVAYGVWAKEPAGTAALLVTFLMASIIAFFLARSHRRLGSRPEDHPDAEVVERAGPVDFFPPRSAHPVTTGLGAALTALGVVHGLWLFLLGVGVLLAGTSGLVFEYLNRD